MALNKPALRDGLFSLFSTPPETVQECAQEWGSIMQTYCAAISPPSTTVAAAAAALVLNLEGAFVSGDLEDIRQAFADFAAAVGDGMVASTKVYPGKPPLDAPGADTHSTAADNWATIIDDWMKTGTAQNPPVTAINWS